MIAFPEVLDGRLVGQSPGSAGEDPRERAAPDPDPIEALGDEIARLSAHIHAATHQLLVLIRRFDEREGWAWGFRSCAEWLSWRTGISPGPAREKVRVARALGDLPLLSEAMARGELSFSKVRALTRVAKPETEGELLELARHATAAHLERIVRGWRLVNRLEEADRAGEAEAQRHASRFLRLHPDHDGSWVLRGRLDPEVGALLEKALEWAREALYRREPAVGPDPFPAEEEEPAEEDESVELEASPEQRLADALGLVAERAFSGKGARPAERGDEEDGEGDQREPISRAERFQVVVHLEASECSSEKIRPGEKSDVSAETPADHVDQEPFAYDVHAGTQAECALPDQVPGVPATERGPTGRVSAGTPEDRAPSSTTLSRQVSLAQAATSFFPETAKRIACDSDLVEMDHDSRGQVLDVGRKRRTIPPAIRRALDHRDGGCRFPGCNCRYADAHHIVHWADGGETKLENLVLLCRRHHRAVHEEGFCVEAVEGPEGLQFRFYRPNGKPFPAVPQAPPAPADAMADLVRRNRVRGVDPDAWTPTPRWQGETLDLSLAIDMLRGLEGAPRGRDGEEAEGFTMTRVP